MNAAPRTIAAIDASAPTTLSRGAKTLPVRPRSTAPTRINPPCNTSKMLRARVRFSAVSMSGTPPMDTDVLISFWRCKTLREIGGDLMAQVTESSGIEIFYGGGQKFPPSPEFAAEANATEALGQRASSAPVGYSTDEARKLSWFKTWDKALEWAAPDARWFVGGQINVSYNCLDHHVADGNDSRHAHHLQ